jgi:hypothetical protein
VIDMTSSLFVRTLTAVLSAGLAFGGSGAAPSLGGPRLGLVFDSAARNLRPISGIPGAAMTGAPLPLGIAIAQAEISPAQNAALVVGARGSAVSLVSAAGGDWVVTALDQVEPAPAKMAFSASGSAAALYYTAGQVRILTGIAATPAVGGEIDVSSLPTPVTALAVDDTGSYLLLAAGPAEAVSLYRVAASAQASLLGSFRSVASVRLFNGGQQALVTDTLAGVVYRITDPAGTAALQMVAGAGDGIQGLVAAETDAAGQRLFTASGDGTVSVSDFNGGMVTTLDCGCVPTGMFRMAGAATFRLTEVGSGPIELLDAGSAPRIVAVPPPIRAAGPREVRR